MPVGLHLPAAMAAVAGLAMVVGMLLPWSSGAQASAFDSVGVVGALTALLLIAAWVMWRTRRRWLAITASAFALLAGLAGATLAAFVALAVLIDDEVRLQAGLAVIFLAGLLGAAAGRRALRRLRSDPRRWVNRSERG
ncbi:MAG: hypothetical protein H0W94_06775 [Actinobacteria bacterium]|nr:hypothetical protein [Actinomycetota bacterium]